jgi:hypothetical protein
MHGTIYGFLRCCESGVFIPDPNLCTKKAPDPGSGSATLDFISEKNPKVIFLSCKKCHESTIYPSKYIPDPT